MQIINLAGLLLILTYLRGFLHNLSDSIMKNKYYAIKKDFFKANRIHNCKIEIEFQLIRGKPSIKQF